jgi:membrane protein YdbS with pleckstrin-like domain
MNNNNSSRGIGFGTVLFLIFLVMKLTDTIDWSWWYVTMPLWIMPAVIVCTLIFCFASVFVVNLFKGGKN